ncbi:MAG: selenocysteine-specific translation elongation factor [Candidatus Geothermincolales bacterium]
MKNFIIGTAGHIDHGKTELIKALTGTDTDRLKEEKERGISIELGFAQLSLPDGTVAGVVDVPGHEHFVKNMLAGATGFDMVLLVVAADDGVMPQTLEHLAIVDLLGVEEGLVVITKADLVDEDMIELVKEDVAEAVKGTVLEGAEVIVTSSRTGQGLNELREAIARIAARVRERESRGPFRLPVDRSFTLKGIGTVVTGTLWEGSVADGDEAEIQPSGKRLRVRNVQVHGNEVERAYAGQRVAMNLPGISKFEVTRGHVIGTPGYLHPTFMLDARLHLLPSCPKPLKNRARVRLHHGTAEVMTRVVLLGGREELPPGESAFVQFRLEKALVARYRDRFIIRSFSPVTTIGGGVILDSQPRKHKFHDTGVFASLEIRERGVPEELVTLALREEGIPLSRERLLRRLEIREDELDRALKGLAESGKVVTVPYDKEELYVLPDVLRELLSGLAATTDDLHSRDPLKPGVEKDVLRQHFRPELDRDVFEALLDLASRDTLEVEAGRVRLKGQGRRLSDQEEGQLEELARQIRDNGFSPPTFKELLEVLGVDRNRLRDLIQILLERGEIEQVNPEYFLYRGRLREVEERVRERLAENGRLAVSDMREMFGVSRKYAIPLLEYLDRKRVTRREGDFRVPFSPSQARKDG